MKKKTLRGNGTTSRRGDRGKVVGKALGDRGNEGERLRERRTVGRDKYIKSNGEEKRSDQKNGIGISRGHRILLGKINTKVMPRSKPVTYVEDWSVVTGAAKTR